METLKRNQPKKSFHVLFTRLAINSKYVKLSFIVILLFIVNCAGQGGLITDRATLKDRLVNKPIIAFSPTYLFSGIEGKFTIQLSLKNHLTNTTKELSYSGFSASQNNGEIFYFTVDPGQYGLLGILPAITLKDVNTTVNLMTIGQAAPKYNFKMGVLFKKIDMINLEAGKIYYIGDFEINCFRIGEGTTEETWTTVSLRIIDKFDKIKKDLEIVDQKIIEQGQLIKKLGLLENLADFDYKIF